MFKRILVAVDGSPTSDRGLDAAIEFARTRQGTLAILHVVDDFLAMPVLAGGAVAGDYVQSMIDALREAGRGILARSQAVARERGVEAQTVLAETLGRTVAHVILGEVRRQHANVVVLGTHGRRGIRRMLMGSDAELVVRDSPVPVLLVRSDVASAASSRPRKRARQAGATN